MLQHDLAALLGVAEQRQADLDVGFGPAAVVQAIQAATSIPGFAALNPGYKLQAHQTAAFLIPSAGSKLLRPQY
jgi:hypothetical protein